MGGAIRELVGFERLGLRHTWHETVEPEPSDLPQLSHQYEGEVDIGGIDPSVDLWGGGGLMSTCRDLARFFRALLRGDVFHDPATLGEMTTLLEGIPAAEEMAVGDDPSDAGMFIFRAEAGGETWWGHDGWWGTTVYTCPRLDLTVVAGHQQAKMPKGFERPGSSTTSSRSWPATPMPGRRSGCHGSAGRERWRCDDTGRFRWLRRWTRRTRSAC